MALIELQHVVTAEQAGRLDQIVQLLTSRSRSEVRGMLQQGCVELNGRPCAKAGLRIEAGSEIIVRHDPHTRYKESPPPPAETAFRVVYEDDHLLVVDKSAGILTVQTDQGGKKTLVDAVTQYLRRRHRNARAVPVHRLDRDTSGLLVMGKNATIAEALMEQFRIRKAEREYAAIVAGRVERRQGTFRTSMATSKRLQRYSVRPGEQGELAITHYAVTEYLRGATHVTVTLETGRRNQIRVHFAEVGHPVLGDERYRPDRSSHPAWKGKGLALHAAVLGFTHPVSGESMRFEAPLPKNFQKFLRGQALGRS
jgi:23S rRNA pseudouridine1911/1915/1917 synthase